MDLLERIELFLEAGRRSKDGTGQNPYKRKSSLGPGPRGGTNKKANKWKCKCKDYVCQCDGKDGEETAVVIDKEYKKKYNKEYKKWGPQKKRRRKEKLS